MDRKLAAIMAIDVVGLAGRVSREEMATLKALEELKNDVIEIQVDAHRGRIFKHLGDGVLAEFSSTVEAVKCAIGIQNMQMQRVPFMSCMIEKHHDHFQIAKSSG